MRAWLGLGVLVVLVGAGTTSAAVAPTVKAASSDALGAKVVVDGAGRTLYRYTLDHGKAIACSGACAKAWPPVIVPRGAKLVAGAGVVRARLGTLARPDGRLQLTYAGLPLYRFAQDRSAGDVNGQGLGGNWFAVGPSGRLVKAAPQTAASGGSGGTTPTPPSSGGGGGANDPAYGY